LQFKWLDFHLRDSHLDELAWLSQTKAQVQFHLCVRHSLMGLHCWGLSCGSWCRYSRSGPSSEPGSVIWDLCDDCLVYSVIWPLLTRIRKSSNSLWVHSIFYVHIQHLRKFHIDCQDAAHHLGDRLPCYFEEQRLVTLSDWYRSPSNYAAGQYQPPLPNFDSKSAYLIESIQIRTASSFHWTWIHIHEVFPIATTSPPIVLTFVSSTPEANSNGLSPTQHTG